MHDYSPGHRRLQIQRLCAAHHPWNTLSFVTSGTSGLSSVGCPSASYLLAASPSLSHMVLHGDFPLYPALHICSYMSHNDFGCVADTKNYFQCGIPCTFHALQQNLHHFYKCNVSG